MTCFEIYFQPVYIYIKRSVDLAVDNNYALSITSATLVGVLQSIELIFNVNFFGVSNWLLLLVLGTVLLDAWYGIKKSKKQSKEALREAKGLDVNTPEYRKLMRVHELKKFKPQKLQFTFFKCVTLLGYLYFAKTLLSSDANNFLGEALGFTSGLLLRAPLAIFWYYDFKSIGDNAAYIHGKKAPIFTIVESIFEFRITKFFKQKDDE